MEDILITLIGIFIAVILMFIFPLLSVAERADDISQLSVQTATIEFVDNVSNTGILTMSEYSNFVNKIQTANSMDVNMEHKILDDNISKKNSWSQQTVIGENIYYSVFTTTIMNALNDSSTGNCYTFKQGDMFSVSVKNTNTTMAQLLRNVFYSIKSNGTYQIAASHASVVKYNGNKSTN